MIQFLCIAAGNILEHQEFDLHWSLVRLDKQLYVVKEEKKLLEIVLHRRGYLGETSFVSEYDCSSSPWLPLKYIIFPVSMAITGTFNFTQLPRFLY